MRPELAEQAVVAHDWDAVRDWLLGMGEEERTEAGRGYARSLRSLARAQVGTARYGAPAHSIQVVLAVGLGRTAKEAARDARLARDWHPGDEAPWPQVVDRLLSLHGEEFTRRFAEEATAVTLRGQALDRAYEVAAATWRAYAHQDMPIPSGTFAVGWAQAARREAQLGLPRDDPPTLAGALRASGRPTELLLACLRTPDVFASWSSHLPATWDVEGSVRDLVARGELDREPVLSEALAALTRPDRATTQRMVGAVLAGLDLSGTDAADRLPLLAHLLPVVPGGVTGVLLPAVLAAGPDEQTLLDVGTVILARREKAAKTVLLDHLLALAPEQRGQTWSLLLSSAADDPDVTISSRARAHAEGPAEGDDTSPEEGGWSVPGRPREDAPFVPYAADASGLEQAVSEALLGERITTQARWLDLVSQLARQDPDLLRARLADERDLTLLGAAPTVIHHWAGTGSPDSAIAEEVQVSTFDPGTGFWKEHAQVWTRTFSRAELFTAGLARETLERLDSDARLLSTPTGADGTLTWPALLGRLEVAPDAGPYDLVQALLRTGPGPAEDLRWPAAAVPVRGHPGMDAVAAARAWLEAGGLPGRTVTLVDGDLDVPGVELPLVGSLGELDGLAELCAPLRATRDERGWLDHGWRAGAFGSAGELNAYLGVVPHWRDAAAAQLRHAAPTDHVDLPRALSTLAAAPGAWALGDHALLAALQDHPRADCRILVVEHLLAGTRSGGLDPDLLAQQTLGVVVEAARPGSRSSFSLARAAKTWEAAQDAGVLGAVWPAAVSVLGAALAADRAPAGVADLLRMLRLALPTAAAHADTASLATLVEPLAGSRGSSKAALEARQLLARLHDLGAS